MSRVRCRSAFREGQADGKLARRMRVIRESSEGVLKWMAEDSNSHRYELDPKASSVNDWRFTGQSTEWNIAEEGLYEKGRRRSRVNMVKDPGILAVSGGFKDIQLCHRRRIERRRCTRL
uniref:Uncharacterized protein n=1 Tax=Panagrellus redivivus TaxID=6233 RepID=A0A7E4V6D4_PANRE